MSTKLYIVATPIGNLKDITLRAIETLKLCSIIVCEDTRITKKLLNHLGVRNKKIYTIHQHNEKSAALKIIEEAALEGEEIAYVTDAGTPCISDPGMFLVSQARSLNIRIEPIPGPSAIIAAFSISGIDEGRFNFVGFLPTKLIAIQESLNQVNQQQKPTIFYESPKRVLNFLENVVNFISPSTKVFIAREMTKLFESFYSDSAENLFRYFMDTPQELKGEFVIIVIPNKIKEKVISNEEITLLKILMKELPLKKAAAIVSEFYNGNKKDIYNIGIDLKNE
jgi:16S rRNA (cytidine1402-2'-O)-methyltransferase